MAHIKGAIADTNKPVLGKADRKRLISIRKKIRHMKRELDELDNICSLRISYTLEGVNVSNYRDKQTGDRLAGLSEK
jgi:hypothetical protein